MGWVHWSRYGSLRQDPLGPYVMQELLLLVAPALFAASIYMVLGRLVLLTDGEKSSMIRSNWMMKIFVCGDVTSFIVQGGGGGLMAQAKTMTVGKHLVVSGLILQILFFGIFVVTSAVFHSRIVRNPTPASLIDPWKKYIYALYAASILILVRSIFRVILFSVPNNSYLNRNEVFVYIFDNLLMMGVILLFNFVHPGAIIGRKKARQHSGEQIQMENDVSHDDFVHEPRK